MPFDGCNRHAIERAYERYGLELDAQGLELIAARIRSGNFGAIHFDKDALVCELPIGGVQVRLVYSYRTKRIITFLPRKAGSEMLFNENKRAHRINWKRRQGRRTK